MKRIVMMCVYCVLFLLLAGCMPQGELPAANGEPAPALSSAPAPAISSAPPASPAPTPDAPRLGLDVYPVMDGSTATKPLSMALAAKVTGETDVDVLERIADHSGTARAYEELRWGEARLLLVYAPPEETERDIEDWNVKPLMTSIGRDALVFLLNENNPVNSLTSEQVRQIYTGEITNWKQVGGEDAPILAFQRNSDSGSQALMKKLVMRDAAMAVPPSESLSIGEMGELVDAIAGYENSANALGYSVYYYVKNMHMQPGIKLLAIDGVAPGNETIRSGAYPFVNDFYAVIREDAPADSPERIVFEYITSEAAKSLIEQAGYVAK